MYHNKNKKEGVGSSNEKIYFKSKLDLRSYLWREFKYRLSEGVIAKTTEKKVIIKNNLYSICRTSQYEYTLQKVKS